MSALVMVALVFGCFAAARYLRRRRTRAEVQQRRRDAAIDVLDLVVITVGSGRSVTQAIELVAQRGPVETRADFQDVLERHHFGSPLATEMRQLGRLIDPSFETMGQLLAEALIQGGGVQVMLGHLSAESRQSRQRQTTARLNRLPVALLVPLAVCGLPAVLLAGVVPLVVLSLSRLGGP